MAISAFGIDVTNFFLEAINATVLAPAAIIPSIGIAILTYLLVSRQIDMIRDEAPSAEEFGTAGEANEWLGGPTSEWLGI